MPLNDRYQENKGNFYSTDLFGGYSVLRQTQINVAERYGFVIDIRDLMGQSSSDVTKCHLKELFNFAA